MTKKQWILQVVVFSSLRSQFRKSPMYHEALRRAKVEVWIDGKKKKKRRVMYTCAHCGELFHNSVGKREVAVDHIDPVVPLGGLPTVNDLPDFNVYIARLFCPVDNLQVLCKVCHSEKTKLENAERRKLKNERKPKESSTNLGRRQRKATKKGSTIVPRANRR